MSSSSTGTTSSIDSATTPRLKTVVDLISSTGFGGGFIFTQVHVAGDLRIFVDASSYSFTTSSSVETGYYICQKDEASAVAATTASVATTTSVAAPTGGINNMATFVVTVFVLVFKH